MTSLRVLAVLIALACTACTATTPTPSPSPSAATRPDIGQWHELVLHLSHVVLVNGGPEAGKPADEPLELWAWNGTAWRLLAADPAGPVWRNFAAVDVDSRRGVIVVHGGGQPGRPQFDETWEWDGAKWTRFDGRAPGGREGAGMAYDASRATMVLFGGAVGTDVRADTWSWDGKVWSRLATTGPSPRFPGLVAYNASDETVVLYGGHAVDGGPTHLADTWSWNGTQWSRAHESSAPGPRVNQGGAFHAGMGQLLLVGGASDTATLADVWAWDGKEWSRIAVTGMPRRQAAGVVYDTARQVVVLTGGIDQAGSTSVFQDVWEYSAGAFTRRAPA